MVSDKLTYSQLKVLADIGVAIGQIAAASMVLPFLLPGLDQARLPVIILGLLITFGSWLFSVLVVKGVAL